MLAEPARSLRSAEMPECSRVQVPVCTGSGFITSTHKIQRGDDMRRCRMFMVWFLRAAENLFFVLTWLGKYINWILVINVWSLCCALFFAVCAPISPIKLGYLLWHCCSCLWFLRCEEELHSLSWCVEELGRTVTEIPYNLATCLIQLYLLYDTFCQRHKEKILFIFSRYLHWCVIFHFSLLHIPGFMICYWTCDIWESIYQVILTHRLTVLSVVHLLHWSVSRPRITMKKKVNIWYNNKC